MDQEEKKVIDRQAQVKAIIMEKIGKYRRAIPPFRIKNLKFYEEAFKFRLELKSFGGRNIGDVYTINKDYYFELTHGWISWDKDAITNSIQEHIITNNIWDHVMFNETYVLVSFVEMAGKNYSEMFCALAKIDSLEIVEGRNESLVVFWLEGLNRV